MNNNEAANICANELYCAVLRKLEYPKIAEGIICDMLPHADVFDVNHRLKRLPLILSEALTDRECQALKNALEPSGASIDFIKTDYKCEHCGRVLATENVYTGIPLDKKTLCKECWELEKLREKEEEAERRLMNRKSLKVRALRSTILSLGVTLVTLGASLLLISTEKPWSLLFLLLPVIAGSLCFSLCYPTDSYYLFIGAGIKLASLKPEGIYELSLHLVLLPFVLLSALFDIIFAVLGSVIMLPKVIGIRAKRIREGDGEDLKPFDRF